MLQGKYSGPPEEQGWVTKFSVTYSNDGIVWNQHVEEGLMVSGNSFCLIQFCWVTGVGKGTAFDWLKVSDNKGFSILFHGVLDSSIFNVFTDGMFK